MFSVTLVSILRLNSLIHFASTDNLTCELLPFYCANLVYWQFLGRGLRDYRLLEYDWMRRRGYMCMPARDKIFVTPGCTWNVWWHWANQVIWDELSFSWKFSIGIVDLCASQRGESTVLPTERYRDFQWTSFTPPDLTDEWIWSGFESEDISPHQQPFSPVQTAHVYSHPSLLRWTFFEQVAVFLC